MHHPCKEFQFWMKLEYFLIMPVIDVCIGIKHFFNKSRKQQTFGEIVFRIKDSTRDIQQFILPLIEILKFDWMRQILYAAILCFLTYLIFLIYPLQVTYWPQITFLNPLHMTLYKVEFYIITSYSTKR